MVLSTGGGKPPSNSPHPPLKKLAGLVTASVPIRKAALHDVQAVLRLIDVGKVRMSAKGFRNL